MRNDTSNTAGIGGQYLTFKVYGELYGVEILKVREIICLLPITPLPHSPPHVMGVINLRGRVIPVTDLRTRFGMPPQEATRESCIIVVEVPDEAGATTMGLIVDEVAEVSDISEEMTSAAPRLGGSVESECLLGVGRIEDRVILLLDIAEALRRSE